MSVNDEREKLIKRISETQRDMGRFFAQERSPLFSSNLTMRQLKVVMVLSFTGSASGQDLAANLGVGLGTVTGIVDRLIGHGLVTRQEDPHDRRVRRIDLTEEGRELVEKFNDTGLHQFRRIMERLETDTLRSLDQVMQEILTVAAELNQSPD